MQVVRAIGVLEPGGIPLSALRLSRALRDHGIETTIVAGDASPAGLELARAHGFEVEHFAEVRNLQWEPCQATQYDGTEKRPPAIADRDEASRDAADRTLQAADGAREIAGGGSGSETRAELDAEVEAEVEAQVERVKAEVERVQADLAERKP